MHLTVKLMEVGMDFWIKIISLVAISGCSSLDNIVFSQDRVYEITDEIRSSPYAMQTIKIDNNEEDLLFLGSVSKTSKVWFKAADLFITTNQGRITKSTGLDNDFEIISYGGFKSLLDSKSLIRFYNPESNYMEIFFSYKVVKEGLMYKVLDNSEFNYRLIEESFSVPLIGWSGKNYYWVDEADDVWLSKQIIEPFGSKVRIKVLKKYSD